MKKGMHHSDIVKWQMSEMRKGEKHWNFGKHYSTKMKIKLSKAHKGKKNPHNVEWNKKIGETHKGMRPSFETKIKLSKAQKKRFLSPIERKRMSEINKGKKNHNFNNYSSFEPYSFEFNWKLKKQIKQRDNYRCQECNQTEKQLGYSLHCHHIDYNKKNNSPNNLISLCVNCHSQTNYKRADWTKYFQNVVRATTP